MNYLEYLSCNYVQGTTKFIREVKSSLYCLSAVV